MDISYSSAQLCNSKIHEQTNTRIYDRNVPSQMLQPYLDVRPVMTKYSHFPIVDPRKALTVPMQQMPTFNINKTFNPGNTTSPWSGFASNVNTESILRNQVYALQKCSQAVFVPSSNSDLYNYKFQSQKQANPHELLFQQDKFQDFNPNPDKNVVGSGMFYNNTRCQLKDMTKQTC
mgnify:CR=1 FL=1|jgi:hypothetical protein